MGEPVVLIVPSTTQLLLAPNMPNPLSCFSCSYCSSIPRLMPLYSTPGGTISGCVESYPASSFAARFAPSRSTIRARTISVSQLPPRFQPIILAHWILSATCQGPGLQRSSVNSLGRLLLLHSMYVFTPC